MSGRVLGVACPTSVTSPAVTEEPPRVSQTRAVSAERFWVTNTLSELPPRPVMGGNIGLGSTGNPPGPPPLALEGLGSKGRGVVRVSCSGACVGAACRGTKLGPCFPRGCERRGDMSFSPWPRPGFVTGFREAGTSTFVHCVGKRLSAFPTGCGRGAACSRTPWAPAQGPVTRSRCGEAVAAGVAAKTVRADGLQA